MNPELDLTLDRIIRAPRAVVWRAWTDPDQFAAWFIPAPMVLRVEAFDATAGGPLRTSMSDDGTTFVPHVDGCFLVVEDGTRIAFTNAIDSAWRPSAPMPVPMTAEIVLDDHPDGTRYRVTVRHGRPEDRARHEELGFSEGWGAVTDQLAALVEQRA